MSQSTRFIWKKRQNLSEAPAENWCLAHPNDPHGTSLAALSKSLVEQTEIIQEKMLPYIDGVECWHSRNTPETTSHYVEFRKEKEVNNDWWKRLPSETNANGHSSNS